MKLYHRYAGRGTLIVPFGTIVGDISRENLYVIVDNAGELPWLVVSADNQSECNTIGSENAVIRALVKGYSAYEEILSGETEPIIKNGRFANESDWNNSFRLAVHPVPFIPDEKEVDKDIGIGVVADRYHGLAGRLRSALKI